jgi:hypothetical protein
MGELRNEDFKIFLCQIREYKVGRTSSTHSGVDKSVAPTQFCRRSLKEQTTLQTQA